MMRRQAQPRSLSHIKGNDAMGMSVPMQAAWDWAEEYEKTLEARDPRLRGCVLVQHEDGTSMMLPWAFAVQYGVQDDLYVLVFTEHHGKQIFARSELTGFVTWAGPPNFDPEPVGSGTEIPYG